MKPNLKINVRTNTCGGICLDLIDSKTGKVYSNLELAYYPTTESILSAIAFMENLKFQIKEQMEEE